VAKIPVQLHHTATGSALRVPRQNRADRLTARELEVLKLVGSGLANREIADQLNRSTRTVDAHLRSIYAKLGIRTRSAATRYAIENGLT
jgi:DNA-binding NarL/FixJ family response regulator